MESLLEHIPYGKENAVSRASLGELRGGGPTGDRKARKMCIRDSFLPFEGLYAEVVNRGLLETLQRDYHVNVAGPSTMAALLNSLQMGFRTLAIQQRSSEVWKVLGAVKAQFAQFAGVLESAQKRVDQLGKDLDTLVGRRTRQIQRALREVETLPEIPLDAAGEGEE